ncbi:MAG: C2 family cysteine protease, partial [bacterium]
MNGHKTPVLVDDYLPCRDGKPIFAHARNSGFWVCLVEKAWAKLHGSYSASSNG